MFTKTLAGRIEAAHSLRNALLDDYRTGVKTGLIRYKSVIDVVETLDEVVGSRQAPDNWEVDKLMDDLLNVVMSKENMELHTAGMNCIECKRHIWDFLDKVNKLANKTVIK